MQFVKRSNHVVIGEQGLHRRNSLVALGKPRSGRTPGPWTATLVEGIATSGENREAVTNAGEEPGSQNAEDKTGRMCSAFRTHNDRG